MVDPVIINLWLKFQKNIKQTYGCPEFLISYVSSPLVGVYVGLSSELSIPYSFIKQSIQCVLHTQTILLGALSVGTTAYLSWK